MTTIDKKDIENIENLKKILKSKNLGSIKIQKGNYAIEVSLNKHSTVSSSDSIMTEKQTTTCHRLLCQNRNINTMKLLRTFLMLLVF